MYTVRRSLHYAFPYFNLVLGFGFLIVGAIAYGIWFNAYAIYEEIEPGVFFAYNIPEYVNIIASFSLVGVAMLIMFPRQYVLDIWRERWRFNRDFKRLPVDKATAFVAGGTAVAFVGVLGIQALGKALGISSGLGIQLFILIFTILYFIGLFIVLPRHYEDIIAYLNNSVPDTQLEYGQKLDPVEISLYGRFQGAKIDFSLLYPDSSSAGRRQFFSRKAKNIKLSCLLKYLNGGPTKDFKIVDRKERWFVIRGQNLDECFNKRFHVTGGNPLELSAAFKESLLNYPRHINITLNTTSIQYDAAYVAHPPYRTREGMILLWVDLLEWHKVSVA